MVSRILLADDSITIQKVVNMTFADEGIEVVAVSNGEMAARRLEEVNPDLVLADIFMPGKNGYELCEAIKTNSKFCNVPVVLLVGAFEPFDQVEARRVQADAHLTKPFESRTLVDTVRKLLGNPNRPHTGPLADAAPAQQESPAPVEEQTWLTPTLVDSTETLEFESASGQWRPADMPGNEPGTRRLVAETIPLDLGQRPDQPPSHFQSDEFQSSGSEVERGMRFWERATGELVSPPGSAESSEQTVSPEDQRVTATGSSFEVQIPAAAEQAAHPPLEIETQALTVESPPASGPDQQQMVVDFEESLPSTPEAEAEASTHDANISGVELGLAGEPGSNEWHMEDVQHAANEWRAANAVNLKTTKLEMPDLPEDDRASLEANGENAAVFGLSEAPAIAESSSLFTAEEPLGDVLSDNGNSEGLSPASESPSPLEESAVTEFNLELSPDETAAVEQVTVAAEVDQVTSPHSERITGELVTAELPMDGQKLVESAARDFVAQEVFEPPWEAPERWVDGELQTVPADESVRGEDPPSDSTSYDWTSPGAVIHSTGRLDSTVMPVEFTESSEKLLEEEDPVKPAAAGVVDEPVNLEAEQMRFAAIDMEASPVEAGDALVQPFQSSERERGFEISPAVGDDQTPGLNGHREASEMPLPPIDLSPMVIDEIVRRVVAQIGDSVVREIAWEIVPDCVERIIDQQTRDALAKR
ncbi:MAG: response regulator [Blastocatellia bacterium]